MIQVIAGIVLLIIVCMVVIAIAFKAQQSIQLSRHKSMLEYGRPAQLLQDAHDLHQFGFAQQLRRRWGGLSSFGLSFNTAALIGSAAVLFGIAIGEGGASVIGFGLPIIALFGLAVSASLAELASAVPTTGGVYHAASALGGRKWGWRAGYFQAAGHLAILALLNCACAALIDRLFSDKFAYQATDFTFWFTVIVLTLAQGALNYWGKPLLGSLQSIGVVLQAGIVLIMLAGLLWLFWPGAYSPALLYQFQNAEWNGTVTGGAFISGTMLLLKLFVGMDGASHGAEETIDPRIRVPWAIYLSTAYTFVFGFVLLAFSLLTTAGSVETGGLGLFLAAAQTGAGGSAVILLLVVGSLWGSGLHTLTISSRILFSLAREKALPLHKKWSAVSMKQQAPYNAIWLGAIASLMLLGFMFIFSRDQMILVLLSFAIISLHISYVIPIVLKLRRGASAGIWRFAPWRLGAWSIPINWLAVGWLTVSSCLAGVYIQYWGAGAVAVTALLIFLLELRNRKRHALRLQSSGIKSQKEIYRLERKFPLND
ncbi:amino acid permease [Paenibacillus paridis]|uniref:amino acid permease n=1 Tax=Paenibacillus paridis TaxID=2583376 RepID=UPI0011218451|nr:amino acid permease [Paenibacillus paridis]